MINNESSKSITVSDTRKLQKIKDLILFIQVLIFSLWIILFAAS